jgi:hypothetical protein
MSDRQDIVVDPGPAGLDASAVPAATTARPAAADASQPGLAQPIAALLPGQRALQICAAAGVSTVADFLRTPKTDFLAQRGCGERTYLDLERRVAMHLHEVAFSGPSGCDPDQRLLLGLVRSPQAERAFMALGLTTVGEFLATPKERLLDVPGFTARTYRSIMARIRETRPVTSALRLLLPQTLLELNLGKVALNPALVRRLADRGCTTFGHVFALPQHVFAQEGELGGQASEDIRHCLEQFFRCALEHVDTLPVEGEIDYPTLKGRLLAPLGDADRELLCQVVGIGATPRTLAEIAIARDFSIDQVNKLADTARWRLHERAPSLLVRMRFEITRELDAFEGVVTGDHLAPRTLAHTMAKATGDRQLPLRLLAFCYPREFHLHDGCLTSLQPRQFRRFLRRLKQLTAPQRLPAPVERLVEQLQQIVDPVPRGLLLLLLRTTCNLKIHIDAKAGEIATRSTRSSSVRLRDILQEEGRPLVLEDLVFHYRDRFRHARQARLITTLRRDPLFLEVGPRCWSLRSWHQDELEAAAHIADGIARKVCATGGKHHVPTLLQADELGERTVHLVLDCLRRDVRVRYLGRGEICPATHTRSQVLEQLLKDFRRAGGEVVFGRFLDNQPQERRRLVRRLLTENRLFVQVAPDRIDVLTNYPFNHDRLQRLLAETDQHLIERGGYDQLTDVLARLNQGEFGGDWMTPTLFGELLRRHGSFELLPAGILARRELALVGHLQAKARTALRKAGLPLTVRELLAEQPALSEFEDCLVDLLRQDPMVQTPDGEHWQLL